MNSKRKVESFTAMNKQKLRQVMDAYEKERKKNLLAQPGPLAVTLVLDHLKPDFNIGKIIRSAEVFGCREVVMAGVPFFDVGPARGAYRHVPSKMVETFDQACEPLRKSGYTLYALDPRRAQLMTKVRLSEKAAFIVGNEGAGFSVDLDEHPHIQRLQIPQYGQTESLNAAVAASVALYEYARQWAGDLPLAGPKKDRQMRGQGE